MSTEGNIVKCLTKSLNPSTSCILYTEMAKFTIHTAMSNRLGEYHFRLATARTAPTSMAIAMPKYSVLLDSINSIVMPVIESRIFERLVIRHVS